MVVSEGTMRPQKPKTTGEDDLFRARLEQIINMKHELVQLAGKIDWDWIDREIAPLYSDKGRPGIETRFVIGLLLLKHIYGLSDEGVCERWVYDPYFQHFTGETFSRLSSTSNVPEQNARRRAEFLATIRKRRTFAAGDRTLASSTARLV